MACSDLAHLAANLQFLTKMEFLSFLQQRHFEHPFFLYSYWQKKFSFTLQLYNARLLIIAFTLIIVKSANDFSRSDMNNCALEMSMFEQ